MVARVAARCLAFGLAVPLVAGCTRDRCDIADGAARADGRVHPWLSLDASRSVPGPVGRNCRYVVQLPSPPDSGAPGTLLLASDGAPNIELRGGLFTMKGYAQAFWLPIDGTRREIVLEPCGVGRGGGNSMLGWWVLRHGFPVQRLDEPEPSSAELDLAAARAVQDGLRVVFEGSELDGLPSVMVRDPGGVSPVSGQVRFVFAAGWVGFGFGGFDLPKVKEPSDLEVAGSAWDWDTKELDRLARRAWTERSIVDLSATAGWGVTWGSPGCYAFRTGRVSGTLLARELIASHVTDRPERDSFVWLEWAISTDRPVSPPPLQPPSFSPEERWAHRSNMLGETGMFAALFRRFHDYRHMRPRLAQSQVCR